MDQESLLLGIDVGTSSIKCVVFDYNGHEVAISNQSPLIISNRPGYSEISMLDLWQQVFSVMQNSISQVKSQKENILGIGISGTACGSWLLDENKEPVGNAILWNDGRAADIVGTWQKEGVLDEIFKISGNSIFPGYPVAVFRWLRDNEPEKLRSARYNLFCKDWIRYKLTGEIAVEHSDMGYFPYDMNNKSVSNSLLTLCGIQDFSNLIPKIIEPGSIAGYLKKNISDELGLRENIPVVAGMVDVAATTLGGGAFMPGQACSIVGTSFLNTLISTQPSFEPFGIGVQTSTIDHTFIRSVVNTSGTINLQWFLDNFCEHEKLFEKSIFNWAERTVSEIPIGSEGVLFHPYINTTGVISPFVNPTARGQFFGISTNHNKSHFLRSIYEGTALSMLDCYQHIPEKISEVYLSGGGARSSFWCQMFADCTGKDILVIQGTELGARGVGILAGCATGVYENIQAAAKAIFKVASHYQPSMENHIKYLQLYELYKSIYEHVAQDWWKRHEIFKSFNVLN